MRHSTKLVRLFAMHLMPSSDGNIVMTFDKAVPLKFTDCVS